MRALIIDDEVSTRESIKLLADFDSFGIDEVYEEKNGLQGYKAICTLNPDLVFLDMNMPVMDGIQMLDILEEDFNGKIIVVSGYTDFKYTHAAVVKKSVVDYIQKPIDLRQLRKSIQKAVNGQDALLDDDLSVLPNDSSEDYDNQKEMLIFSIVIPDFKKVLKQRYNNLPELLKYELMNILEKKFPGIRLYEENTRAYSFVLDFCIESKGLNENEFRDKIQKLIQEISIHKEYQIMVIYKSQPIKGDDLNYCFTSIYECLSHINLNKKVKAYDCKGTNYSDSKAVYEDLRRLTIGIPGCLKKKNINAVNDIMNDVRTKLKKLDYLSIYMLRSIHLNIVSQIKESMGNNVDNLSASLAKIHEKTYSRDNLYTMNYAKDLLDEFIDEVIMHYDEASFNLPSSLIDMMNYVEENFDQKITLSKLSEEFYFSSTYISKMFAKYLNINFSEYLNNKRLEKAKELLKDLNLRICDVALDIGYDNAGYFSRQFKKKYDMSPVEYRNSIT